MRYCTLADLQLAIPLQTLIALSNDAQPDLSYGGPSVPPQLVMEVIEDRVRQAEEVVDAHLRGRYTLPLLPVPTVIKDIAIKLARHELYARRPEGGDLPDAVTRTYKASMSMLEQIRDGKLTIGMPLTGEAAPEAGEMKVRTRERRFNNNVLDRY
jgi:phage gp36-like protein